MKIIKFDLPINGIKVKTPEELQNNITSELLELGRHGKLAKWFRSRGLVGEALAVEQTNILKDDVDCFIALCKVLFVEVSREDAELVILPAPEPGRPLLEDCSINESRLIDVIEALVIKIVDYANDAIARQLVVELLKERARISNSASEYVINFVSLEGNYSVKAKSGKWVDKGELLIENGGRWPINLYASHAGNVFRVGGGCIVIEVESHTVEQIQANHDSQDVIVKSIDYLFTR